jgi:hypothetical protein
VLKRSKVSTSTEATHTKAEDESSTSEDLVPETSSLSLEDTVSAQKHKHLNVIEEYEKSNMKKSLSFVVVGKTAIVLPDPLRANCPI